MSSARRLKDKPSLMIWARKIANIFVFSSSFLKLMVLLIVFSSIVYEKSIPHKLDKVKKKELLFLKKGDTNINGEN